MTNYNHLKEWEDNKEDEGNPFCKFGHENCSCGEDDIQTPITHEPVLTRRGVYKDLKHSPFEIIVNGKVLKFSSEAKKRKFETEMSMKELQLDNSFKRIYGSDFDREKTNFNGLIDSMIVFHYNKLKLK